LKTGFIDFENQHDAADAVKGLDGKLVYSIFINEQQ